MPKIKRAIAAGAKKQLNKADLSAARVLEELRRIAFLDVADFFDADSHLLDIHQMSKEARACIAGLEVARANLDRTDGKRDEEWLHKIKIVQKTDALEMLAKYFKLLVEQVHVTSDWAQLAARLASARQRVEVVDALPIRRKRLPSA